MNISFPHMMIILGSVCMCECVTRIVCDTGGRACMWTFPMKWQSLVTTRYFRCFGYLSFLVCTFCCWHFCLQRMFHSHFSSCKQSCMHVIHSLSCSLPAFYLRWMYVSVCVFFSLSFVRDNNRVQFILLESKVFSAIFGSLCRWRWMVCRWCRCRC